MKMQSRMSGMMLAGVAAFALCAFGGTSTWKSTATGGWSDPDSWEGGVPGSTSTVVVPDNVDLPVYDADVTYAGAVSNITLGTGSRIVFNVTENECIMTGTITGNGTIVKYGTNIVHLTNEEVGGYYAKGGGMEVHEGILECPQTFPNSYNSTLMRIGPLYVAEGALFRPYARYRTTLTPSITGKGLIKSTLMGGYWPIRYDSDEPCTFEGRIDGHIRLQINGPIDFMTTSNTFYGTFSMYNTKADVGVLKFGYGRNDMYTSIGAPYYASDSSSDKNRYLTFSSVYGRIRYLGEGELTDRMVRFDGSAQQEAIFDGGATGGLVLAGRIFANAVGQKLLTLDGSNTTACVIRGAMGDYGDNTIYIAKKGTGTWRLEGATDRLNRGVVGVEQGTLQFDSLTETNIPCSFGLSTRLAKKYLATAWDEAQRADYAILLGSSDAEGVLEWVGTNLWDNASSTRPVAVTGRGGRIVSSVEGRRIGLKGAFAADAGGGTLTLDGDGTTNYLYNVSDGHGKMSVAKDGSGTWILAGDQTFSGRLAVNEGEVVVSATAGRKYSWYRFSIKGSTDSKRVRIYEMALYDASGNRLNRGLTYDAASYNTIPATGSACYWRKDRGETLPKLFDGYAQWASGNAYLYDVQLGKALDPANPDTWIQIVMRFDDSVASAAYYDICSENSSTNSIPEFTATWQPTYWTMEASADGIFWDTVADMEGFDGTYASKHWFSDDTAFTNGRRTPAGEDFAFGLDNGKSLITGTPNQLSDVTVTVTTGAVLRAEGDVTIHALEGGAGGIGTIDGFALAPDGTFNLTGVEHLDNPVAVPVAFMNVTGTENIKNWSLKVGGRRAYGRVKYANGQIVACPHGTALLLR